MYWVASVVAGALVLAIAFILILRRQVRLKTRSVVEASDQYLCMLQSTTDGFCRIGRDGRLLDANLCYENLSGYSREELIGMPVDQLDQIESADDVQKHMMELIESGFTRFETKHRRKNGIIWDVEVSSSYLPSKNEMITFLRDITESKLAAVEKIASYTRFKSIMDSLDALVYVADMQTYELLFINEYGKKLFGNIEGQICWQTLQSDQSGPCTFCTNDRLILENGEPAGVCVWEFQNTVNGCWYQCRDKAIHWHDNRLVRMEIATDITERKLYESALIESNDRFMSLADNTPGYVTYVNAGTLQYEFVNAAFEKSFGRPREKIIGSHIKELLGDANYQYALPYIAEARSGKAVSYENSFDLATGKRWVRVNYNPVFNAAGEVTSIVVLSYDITERRSAEEQVKSLSQRLQLATTSARLGVWDWNVRENTIVWDDRMLELYGITRDTFPSNIDAWLDGLHPEDKVTAIAECQEALKGDKEFDTVFRVIHPDGTVKHLKANGLVVRDADGTAERMIGINADITEQKLSEERLKDNEEQLKAIFETSSDAIGVSCKRTHIIANPSYLNAFGISSLSELRETSVLDLIGPSEHERIKSYIKMRAESKPVPLHYETLGLRKKGSEFPMDVNLSSYTKAEELYTVVIIRDISEQKRAEEEKKALEQQLQHTQKLESLGVLSGGIAHDFNNILAIIMGYCSLTKMDYSSAEKNIPIIENAAERAAGLCRQMLAYAGKAQLTKTNINIVEKVDDIVGMLKATLPQNVVIKTDLSAEIPIIEGDASQLGQVVMNLIINASEAIGTEQGVVDVSLSSIKVIAGKVYEDYHGKPIFPGEYVCLEVTDNGCGMSEEIKWRIFEPFYTTKFTGRGLGMSAVLGIINSHNGALQLFSQLGHGTTFKVFLPAPADETRKDEKNIEPTKPDQWRGTGTILLVEDEDPIRDIAKNFLEMFGFSVLEAVNGSEALDIYQKNAAEITLVVTDMGMPVMDGYELFSELKRINSELPIIVSSGYGDAEVSARIGSDNIAGIISKPYNPSQLREVLKSVVESI